MSVVQDRDSPYVSKVTLYGAAGVSGAASAVLVDPRWPDLAFVLLFARDGSLIDFRVTDQLVITEREAPAAPAMSDDQQRMLREKFPALPPLSPRKPPPLRLPTARTPITRRLLQEIPLGELERVGRAAVQSRLAAIDEAFAASQLPDTARAQSRNALDDFDESTRPGVRGRSDVVYARVARRYVEICAESSAPIKALAAESGYSRSRIRNIVLAARDRGLLSTPGGTKPGGQLTEKAIRLLRAEEGK